MAFPSAIHKTLILLVLCSALFALSACTTQRVAYDYDPGVDFVSFKSYRWLPPDHVGKDDPRIKNDLLDQRIQRAINQVLQSKRYIRHDQDQRPVDFLLTYQMAIDKRVDVDEIETGFGFGYRFWNLGVSTETVVREYDEITLYIDMLDPGTEKLIWRGMRTYRYRSGGTVAERDARIQQIVTEILSGFPPTP